MENERREKRMTLGGLLLAQRRRLTGFTAATVVLSVAAPLKSFIMQWLIDAGSREQALGAMGWAFWWCWSAIWRSCSAATAFPPWRHRRFAAPGAGSWSGCPGAP